MFITLTFLIVVYTSVAGGYRKDFMRSSAVLLVVMTFLSVSAAKDAFQTSDFAKQQLNSIGNEQARGAVKNQLVQGTLTFQWLNAASGAEGQLQFVSEGDKF